MAHIDPSAHVDERAEIADDAVIGPGCVVRGAVRVESGVRLMPYAVVQGPATIGADTVMYPFSCVGFPAQDFKFAPDSPTAGVVIGPDCVLREHATVHAATNTETPTTLGRRVYMMVSSHAAHDCIVGDRVTMINGSCLAGHVVVGDDVTLGGNALIHQFCRIGRFVMMSGDCAVSKDVPPFCIVAERNRVSGINVIGLRRAGFERAEISALTRAFKNGLRDGLDRASTIERLGDGADGSTAVAEMIEFVRSSERGVTPGIGRGLRGRTADDA